MSRSLYLDKADEHSGHCDGCGHKFIVGEQTLSGIESCCGGCYRRICSNCIKWIQSLRLPHESNARELDE